MRARSYDPRAALRLTLGGIPGVLSAGPLVKSLPPGLLRWLVVVVLYAAVMVFRSAMWEGIPATAVAPAAD